MSSRQAPRISRYDFVASLGPLSAAAKLVGAGVKVSLTGGYSVLMPAAIRYCLGATRWTDPGKAIQRAL